MRRVHSAFDDSAFKDAVVTSTAGRNAMLVLDALAAKMSATPSIENLELDFDRAYSNEDLDRLCDIAQTCIRENTSVQAAEDLLVQINMYRTRQQ